MNKKLPPKFKGCKYCRNCGYCEIISIRFRGRSQTICKITNKTSYSTTRNKSYKEHGVGRRSANSTGNISNESF